MDERRNMVLRIGFVRYPTAWSTLMDRAGPLLSASGNLPSLWRNTNMEIAGVAIE